MLAFAWLAIRVEVSGFRTPPIAQRFVSARGGPQGDIAASVCRALSAQIASSGALSSGRHAGSLADAGISGERFPGLRIERCCPAQTVVLLELTEDPLRLGTQDAIK